MSRLDRLMALVDGGETVVIDGAVGTECERRGVAKLERAWNGGAALSDPDVVRQIHRDYIVAGAQVIIANTFATHKHVLESAGVVGDFVAYNRRAVGLVIEARTAAGAEDVVVAAGISNWTWSGEPPSLEVLRRNSAEQAAIMKAAGAELLILEMMISIETMRATLEGALTAGLPIWVGLTCGDEQGAASSQDGVVRLRAGEPLTEAIAALDGYPVEAVVIMHTDVDLIEDCIVAAKQVWSGALGVYAHSGDHTFGDWHFDQVVSPADYAVHAQRWSAQGARIIGGCCGTGPEHIQALTSLFDPPRGSTPTAD